MLGGGFWEWISQFGGLTVLLIGAAFFVWLLATGRIYLAPQVEREISRYKEVIQDQRDTIKRKDETIDKTTEVLPEILAHVRLGNHAMTEIQKGPR